MLDVRVTNLHQALETYINILMRTISIVTLKEIYKTLLYIYESKGKQE